jgi:molybdopterin/thiamine biosynthesis adenylyltransferase
MLSVLALGAVIWGFGRLLGLSQRLRLYAIAGVWVLAGLLFALAGDRLADVAGANVKSWAAASAVAVLVGGYLAGLRWLRRRATPEAPKVEAGARKPAFSDAELDRYARHILLREIGGPGQKRMKAARVLVVGAGGLGAPVLQYLAASGVGQITVVDDDVVDASNLQRQVIHSTDWIGQPKVASAAAALKALNPFVEVVPVQARLTEDNAAALIAGQDLVLDGSDNFDTRYLVNRVAVAAGVPLISAAITQWEGQISLYHPADGAPCYECIFPDRPAPGMVPTCAEAGVAAPLPGIVGSMMAMEAVKHLTGAGQTLKGRLLIYDALYVETRVFQIERRADCPVCGTPHADKP